MADGTTNPQILAARFATGGAEGRLPIEAWRSQFGRAICELDIDPLPGREFRSEATLRALPGLGIASGRCSGARYWRPSHLITNDDLIFVINHEGTDLAKQRGRDCVVAAGEAVLMNAGETGGVTNKSGARFTTMRVPHAALAPALADCDRAITRPIPARNEALRLLLNYVSILETAPRLPAAQLVVSHVYDLMALAIGATTDAAHVATRRGLPAARLRAVKSTIAARIAGGGPVDINTVAARIAVTPRYIQMLFENEGTTFSEFVLMQRLARAYRQLANTDQGHCRISDVIFAAGFNDVSYFNRVFRRNFGCTPSDVRAVRRDKT